MVSTWPAARLAAAVPERLAVLELNSKYKRLGNSDYYVAKDGDGSVYYRALDDGKGGKVLVQNWDAQAVKPSKTASRVGNDWIPETLPPEVWDHPSLNYAEIPPDKRAVMLERARRDEMYKPEVIDGFVKRAVDTTARGRISPTCQHGLRPARSNLTELGIVTTQKFMRNW